ncbi:MAG: hypothetical protein ABEJ56_04800 [Candidatus Nanohaloarchaea archaeon]
MKGQYLAVESVLTFAMGLSLAITTLAIFTNYQNSIDTTTENKERKIVNNRIKSAIYDLNSSHSGNKLLELPEDIGGKDYTVTINQEIKTITASEEFSTSISNFETYDMSGSVSGGDARLYKTGRKYVLRSE